MPQYNYKVVDRNGFERNGFIEAEDKSSAAEQLKLEGYYVIDVILKKTSLSLLNKNIFYKRVNSRDLAAFCRQLSTMLGAGIPLLQSLTTLEKQLTKTKLQNAVSEVRSDLEGGYSFADSLSRHPRIFPALMVSMVNAGEIGGMLDEVLERLSFHFNRDYEIQEKVKGALAYPAVVMLVSIAVVIIMLTVVLPSFKGLLEGMNVKLPLPTRLILLFSSSFINYWYVIIALAVLAVIMLYKYSTTEKGKYNLHSLVLKVPIFGDLIKKLLIARFSRTLGTLLQGGVPILQSLELAGETSSNLIVVEAIKNAQDSIREGESMTEPLQRTGIFPVMVIQMISVGEETGSLSDLLSKISEFYEDEVNTKVNKLSSLLEPVILIVMGFIVGFIVISIILPLFNLVGAV